MIMCCLIVVTYNTPFFDNSFLRVPVKLLTGLYRIYQVNRFPD